MYKIINLILGVIVAAGIPLSMLAAAIWYAKKIDKNERDNYS